MAPLVSICIPVFNGEKYLPEAMESALSQTYRPLEIIVSDDASSDRSLEIVKSYIAQTEIPIHIHTHMPQGIGANWNHCIRQAKGDYIKFLFQDDAMQPDCVEKLMAVAQENKRIGLAFCKRTILHDPANEYHIQWVEKYKDLHMSLPGLQRVNSGRQLLKGMNIYDHPRNKIGEPITTLLSKKVFARVGYFNERLVQSLDYEFWYRLMACFDVGFVDERLVSFRLHNLQATFQNRENGKLKGEQRLYEQGLLKSKVFWSLPFSNRIQILRNNYPNFDRLFIIGSFLKKVFTN